MKTSAERPRYGLSIKGVLLDLDNSVHYQELKKTEDTTQPRATNEDAGYT